VPCVLVLALVWLANGAIPKLEKEIPSSYVEPLYVDNLAEAINDQLKPKLPISLVSTHERDEDQDEDYDAPTMQTTTTTTTQGLEQQQEQEKDSSQTPEFVTALSTNEQSSTSTKSQETLQRGTVVSFLQNRAGTTKSMITPVLLDHLDSPHPHLIHTASTTNLFQVDSSLKATRKSMKKVIPVLLDNLDTPHPWLIPTPATTTTNLLQVNSRFSSSLTFKKSMITPITVDRLESPHPHLIHTSPTMKTNLLQVDPPAATTAASTSTTSTTSTSLGDLTDLLPLKGFEPYPALSAGGGYADELDGVRYAYGHGYDYTIPQFQPLPPWDVNSGQYVQYDPVSTPLYKSQLTQGQLTPQFLLHPPADLSSMGQLRGHTFSFGHFGYQPYPNSVPVNFFQ